jgi:hypothetical protein
MKTSQFDNNYGIIYIFIKNIKTIFLNKKIGYSTILFLNTIGYVYFCVSKIFLKKIEIFLFFSLLNINIFLVFLDHFDAMIS